MKKIIGIGNALVDVLRHVENDKVLENLKLPRGSMQLIDQNRFEEINNFFLGFEKKMVTGGSAANTILALASLGAAPGFIGKVKKDEFGLFFEKFFTDHGVDLKLSYGKLPSGVCSALISQDGERTMATYLGSSGTLKVSDLNEELFKGYSYLYVEGYLVQNHDLIKQAILMAKKLGLKVAIDLASYNIVASDHTFFTYLMNEIDIVFANEEECKAFTGCEPEEGVDELAKLCEIAVVKVGPRGVWVRRGEEKIFDPAVQVPKVLDTTGAGDLFAAGFLYGLSQNADLKKCAEIGSLLAGEIIQIVGAALAPSKWVGIKQTVDNIINK